MALTLLRVVLLLWLLPMTVFLAASAAREVNALGPLFRERTNRYVSAFRPFVRPSLLVYVPLRIGIALWEGEFVDVGFVVLWAASAWWVAGRGVERDLPRGARAPKE